MIRLLLLSLALLLGGCNFIYKQNIPQGNVLDEEDMDQLQVGLTKRQVLVLLGSPAVQDPFHADRWDYVNSFARRGGEAERRTLTVRFENDRVVDFHGNYLDDSGIAGSVDPVDLEIIDPDSNQPVLPRRQRGDDEDDVLPPAEPPR